MFIKPPFGWNFEVKETENYWYIKIPAFEQNNDFTIEKPSGAIHYSWGLI
jgi:hypothetical protein